MHMHMYGGKTDINIFFFLQIHVAHKILSKLLNDFMINDFTLYAYITSVQFHICYLYSIYAWTFKYIYAIKWANNVVRTFAAWCVFSVGHLSSYTPSCSTNRKSSNWSLTGYNGKRRNPQRYLCDS